MLSYWEKKNFITYDLIIVGAGIVGLSTALQFKEKFPSKSVLVLERGVFPSGASTKNAGFACFGSLTEILDDLNTLPEHEVFSLVEKRYKGLLAIRNRFGDVALEYKGWGGYELITFNEISALDQMESINALLSSAVGPNVFSLVPEVKSFGFGNTVQAVVKNQYEGELDSGKFIQALWHQCAALEIKILTGVEVKAIDFQEGRLEACGIGDSLVKFKAEKIALCTNAFTNAFLPDLDIKPGRGLIMVTHPLPRPIPWRGSFHYDKGYVYFRNVDNRLLIGGGRNLDFTGEETAYFGTNPRVKEYLMNLLNEVILPQFDPMIEMEWSGIMAFGKDKRPLIQYIHPKLAIAVRLGGMGVAIGWQTASDLVKILGE
jgi:gamma-glutamylputrescine oxidase